jgi:glycosyltransferase involved in cell wall biosynthesis
VPESRVGVLVPAYRAERTIARVVSLIRATVDLPVVVVDDGSGDGTSEAARSAGATVVTLEQNGGKGTALWRGMAKCREMGLDWVVTVDADGQHLPQEISRFQPLTNSDKCGLVVGARELRPRSMPWPRVCSNRLTTALLELQAGCRLWDSQCGYRMYRIQAVMESKLPEQGRFEWESSALVRIARRGWKIERVGISTVYEDEGSHIHPWRDTARFIRLWFGLWRVVFAKS